jgi:hypothetical protein
MVAPEPSGALAGTLGPGMGFAVRGLARGRGCRAQWVQIDEGAWACGDQGELSAQEPTARNLIPSGEDPMPWSYAFTGRDGVRAYRTEEAALALSTAPEAAELWEANWGFAIDALAGRGEGRVLRSRSGFFLRRRDVYRADPTAFEGGSFRSLEGGERGIPFGWVALAGTQAFSQPEERGAGEPLARLSRVRVYEVAGEGRRAMARIGEGRWARADHLRWISPSPPPPEVDPSRRERWVDVDARTQTLIAYEGVEPVYATMVSTGRGAFATPPGTFRVWSRHLAYTMDNTENANLPNHFRLGDVPYVQFFDDDRGLHGVYWHDGFGVARSHGCVNLSPRDARWLFRFAREPLPPGWLSRAVPEGRGMIVRVRGRYPFDAPRATPRA